MNWRFIVIGLIVFVPFIMMGKNPFQAPDGYVPPDEFKEGLRAKIEQPTGGFSSSVGGGLLGGSGTITNMPNSNGFGGFGGAANNTAGGSMLPLAPLSNQQQNNPANPFVQQGNTGAITNSGNNVGIAPPSQAYQNGGNAPGFAPQPLQQPAQPAPFQNLPTPGSRLELPQGYPSFSDKKGRVVAFMGADVFTTDKKGIVKRMADGTYQLNNGMELIVKEGKKWWPKDANKLVFSDSQL